MKKRHTDKLLCYASLVFLILIISANKISASNYVTVATIGASPSMDKNQDPQKLIEQVIKFWEKELKQVLPDKPDLIVLPEYCDLSGAGKDYLSVRKNQVLDYFASVAKNNQCYIAYGTKRIDSEGHWRNSLIILDREGIIAGIYNKNFPTIGEMEEGTKAGSEAPIIQCDFGTVAGAICFDLNFDELRKEYETKKPDIILFSSMYHGGLVQSNWAYTCRSHFIGALHKGTPSEIRNPLGEIIATNTNYFDFVVTRINLDCKLVHLDFNWEKLTKLKEKYGKKVTINDPGKLGAVLISSEDKNTSIDQMIKEFDIEILDDYLKRARTFRLIEGNTK
jgi:Carbon-nitrogen hydrolase